MAFQIGIKKSTGHTNDYWRIGQFAISAMGAGGNVAVAGYSSAEDRLAGADPDDGRQIALDNASVMRLSATTVVDYLTAVGVDTSAWPADVLATLGQVRLYDQIAGTLYREIRSVDGSEFATATDV